MKELNIEQLKKMPISELPQVAKLIRQGIFNRLEIKGGHSGPNLGVVEMTIALHYVFNSPNDKFIFDVSHQCYAHKMLTGRSEAFLDVTKINDVTGFTNPQESEHDLFQIGHTSTAISLAHGLAKGRDLCKGTENIVAIVGDGSLGGGLALEGLTNAATLTSNLIIIVNDNDQSIAENHGGLYTNLKELRESKGTSTNNIFTALGLDYKYIEDGHDFEQLISTFNQVKDTNKPVVLHIKTIKGKGYKPAELNREQFHGGGAIDLVNAKYKNQAVPTFKSEMTKYLVAKMEMDQTVSVITAGTPATLGFNSNLRNQFKTQFIDTGITEGHAITMAGAMTKNGAKPIVGVSSSFLQRAYDQLIHDVAINNLPVTIMVYKNGVNGFKDVTHLGFYDIPMLINIPNFTYLAPTSLEEQIAMSDFAIEQSGGPVAIRIPSTPLVTTGVKDMTDYSQLNKYQVDNWGTDVAIVGVGSFYQLAKTVSEKIEKELGFIPTLINPKFISGVDSELLENLSENHKLIVTLEDGQVAGGFGTMISSHLSQSSIKVLNLGIEKEFVDGFSPEQLMIDNGLTPDQIICNIRKIINN